VRVLICDDHAVFADSLALVVRGAGHGIVGVAYDPDGAVAMLRTEPADICLIDLHFPGGTVLERMPELREAGPGTRFVVLTGFLDRQLLESGVDAGIRGFAHKGRQARDILALLCRVHAGELVVDDTPGRRPAATRPRSQAQQVARFLTPREREVLTRLALGESTTTLAKKMGITHSTARSHIQSVLTKLGVHSQREAVVEAARNGLVSVETGEWLAG
jgi:two-component system, NarL family, nitrate/nitrite response regulator NarL